MMLKAVVMLSIASLSFPQSKSNAAQDSRIEGVWMVVTADLGGQPLPAEAFKDSRLVLESGQYTFQNDKGTYKLNPTATPGAMDIVGNSGPNQGKTFLAIYELTGDTLKICYDLEGKSRPTEFKTNPGTRLFLANYRRVRA